MDELQRRPSEFAEILGGDNPPLIVGGQAVNIWAELYASRIDPLTNFEPFVSRDADIFGTRALAEELARKAGWNCKFVETKESVIVAILSKNTADQKPLTIEVLSEINGLNEADLAASQLVETESGIRFRIPSPLVLLKAKLYNLASLVLQDRPQDLKHAQMLVHIVPLYLKDLSNDHLRGRVPSSTYRASFEYARAVIASPMAQGVARSRGLSLDGLLPSILDSRSIPRQKQEREIEPER